MIDDHERRRAPASQKGAFITRIISVSIKGSDKFPPPKTPARLTLLRGIIAALVAREGWPQIEAIVFPGGFFRLKRVISLVTLKKRFSLFLKTSLAGDILSAAATLEERWPGVALIIGLDSDAFDADIGGDQLVAVWQQGALVTLTRKAFPVDGDTNGRNTKGKEPVFFVVADDADDPSRCITLSNGARALILSCYDAFAVRGLYGRRHLDLAAIRLLSTSEGRPHEPSANQKRDHVKRWLAFLDSHPPDLALIAIHRFRQPGQDGYWQRHGIAGASAALRGAPVIGAAHFKRALPPDFSASPLAAADVPLAHLEHGPHRKAHSVKPNDAFTLRDAQGEAVAFCRLFLFQHGDDTK
jgi:hypothetical protein